MIILYSGVGRTAVPSLGHVLLREGEQPVPVKVSGAQREWTYINENKLLFWRWATQSPQELTYPIKKFIHKKHNIREVTSINC